MIANRTAVMLVTLCTFGSTSAWGHMMYSNWLLGVTGGFSAQKTKTSIDVLYTQPNVTYASNPATANIYYFHSNGFLGGIFAGYQQVCRNWLVGIEAELDWQNIDLNQRVLFSDVSALTGGAGFGWSVNVNSRTKAAASLVARFGFVLNTMIPDVQVIPYVRLGVEGNQQTLDIDIGGSNTYPLATFSQVERWPIRFIGGAGFEFPLYQSALSIRIEYAYHSRGQSLNNSQLIVDSGIINPLFSTDINTETNTGKLALVWNFY